MTSKIEQWNAVWHHTVVLFTRTSATKCSITIQIHFVNGIARRKNPRALTTGACETCSDKMFYSITKHSLRQLSAETRSYSQMSMVRESTVGLPALCHKRISPTAFIASTNQGTQQRDCPHWQWSQNRVPGVLIYKQSLQQEINEQTGSRDCLTLYVKQSSRATHS